MNVEHEVVEQKRFGDEDFAFACGLKISLDFLF